MKTLDVAKAGVLLNLREELTRLHEAIQRHGAKITIEVDYPNGALTRTFRSGEVPGDGEHVARYRTEMYEVIRKELLTALDELDAECTGRLRDLGVEDVK